METIHIGISDEHLEEGRDLLNKLLADEHILYIKTRKFHWNVRGHLFRSLHEIFEDQYNDLQEQIDSIAERIRMLGFFADGTLEEFKDKGRLKENPEENPSADKMVKLLVKDHQSIIKTIREYQETFSEKLRDEGTNDFLVGLMRSHEEKAWMLRSIIG